MNGGRCGNPREIGSIASDAFIARRIVAVETKYTNIAPKGIGIS
jgi:hypothetical protein